MKNTQGPWIFLGSHCIAQAGNTNATVAKVQKSGGYGHKFAKGGPEANAYLIAAAPELYEELRELVFFLQNFDPSDRNYDSIRKTRIHMALKILARARGER